MRVIHTASRTVTIWFIGEEAPSQSGAMALVRGALKHAGHSPWARTEAECFTAGDETLLIARPGEDCSEGG